MVMGSNLSSNLNVAISALRGLAAAGYFSPDQLSAMECVLHGKKETANAGKQWLTIIEASNYSKISRTSLWKHSQLGHLSIHKIGRRRLIERSELDDFILKGQEMVWGPPQKATGEAGREMDGMQSEGE